MITLSIEPYHESKLIEENLIEEIPIFTFCGKIRRYVLW